MTPPFCVQRGSGGEVFKRRLKTPAFDPTIPGERVATAWLALNEEAR